MSLEENPFLPIYAILGILIAFLVIILIGMSMMENSKQQFCQENGWKEYIEPDRESRFYYCHSEGKLSQSFFCNNNFLNNKCYFVEASK